jgi:hypothetical protein
MKTIRIRRVIARDACVSKAQGSESEEAPEQANSSSLALYA